MALERNLQLEHLPNIMAARAWFLKMLKLARWYVCVCVCVCVCPSPRP